MTTATQNQTREWTTTVKGGVAYLRVDLDGKIEFKHNTSGDWIALDEIKDHLSSDTKFGIYQTAEKALARLRKDAREKAIQELRDTEFLVETNSGTYGAMEAFRAIGVGDPQFADYRIYESVGGARRREGCDRKDAPGYARRMNASALCEAREQLEELLSNSAR